MKKIIILVLALIMGLEFPAFAIGTHNQVDNSLKENDSLLTPELIDYASKLSKKIRKNWIHPKINGSAIISYEIIVDKKGNLVSTKLLKGIPDTNMENDLFMKSTDEAITKAFPYNPFPNSYSKENIKVVQTFAVKPRRRVIDIYKAENKNYLMGLPKNKQKFINNYQKYELKELNTNWLPPYYKPRKKTVVKFDIDEKGTISDIKILQSSQSKAFDDAVINYLNQLQCTPSGEKVTFSARVFSYGLSRKDSVMVGILSGSLSILSLPIIYYMGLE